MTFSEATNGANKKSLGMKWYKFLIYFALIFGAIINIIYSFGYISGSVYMVETNGDVTAEQVYAYYGTGLQMVDILYGFFLIAFAILGFVLRGKLANYDPDSLKFIKIFYSLSAGLPLLYAIIVSVITEQPLSVETISSVIISLMFLILNIKYFKKRAHLFIDETVSSQPSMIECKSCGYKDKKYFDACPKCGNYSKQYTYENNEPVVTDQICFCRKCGEKLIDNSQFCSKCGTKITNE